MCTAAGFATAQAIQSWIEAQFEVVYTRGSIHTLLARLGDSAEEATAPVQQTVRVTRTEMIPICNIASNGHKVAIPTRPATGRVGKR